MGKRWNTSRYNSYEVPQPPRKQQLLEVGVFLFLIMPSMALSLSIMRQQVLSFKLLAISVIAQDLSLVCLIIFLIWRNRESFSHLGWSFGDGWLEVGLGFALFVPVFYGTSLLSALLKKIGFSAPAQPLPSFLTPTGLPEYLLAFFLVVVVAVSEETIFRGYLILRFRALHKNPIVAVALSTAIFSLGHGYEGPAGLVAVLVIGAILALVYLWRGSLVAPIIIHFMQDFTGLILAPLVRAGVS